MERPLSSFPFDVLRVLQTLAGSLDAIVVYGSASTQRLYWPGDVDALCAVQPTPALLQERVRACLKTTGLWLCDIKCGADAADASGAARWTSAQILKGSNGKLTLAKACAQTDALCKLDAVAWISQQAKMLEFSMLFRSGGFKEDLASLRKDLAEKQKEGEWIKAAKRARSIAVHQGALERADALLSILNSPAGQASQIAGDAACLDTLLEFSSWPELPDEKIKAELNMIKYRASGVYGLSAAKEGKVAALCDAAQKVPSTRAGIAPMHAIVQRIAQILKQFANESAHKQLIAKKLL